MNPIETLALTSLQPTQFDAATELLTASFADDPLLHYLVPADVCDRQTVMAYLFRMLLICGAGGGHSYCLSDGQTLKGVVIWMPPEQSVDLIDLLRAGLYELPFRLPLQYLPRWQAALALDHYRHQAMPQPHWYLMLLAVSPSCQRQGVGHQLMQPGLDESTRTHHPCYVETSTEGAVHFYQRHGFEIVNTNYL
ncbi:GNAT family N-acetyltransferase [Nodosilinea sp. FACHB-13]|uniref:GNAT family N-acetyltransferase n=1 Tax=Cyanophyceae TaxID=3028117 RepID=UPI0016848BB6|nr:GNAT family N-acetyltransferase [Nodosilinea sp. FACHB-13]